MAKNKPAAADDLAPAPDTPTIGHNSGGIAADQLKAFIERIERLEEEKAALMADIKEVYTEAKGTGFETKIMRRMVKLRKMDDGARSEMAELLDIYARALGIMDIC